jgi:hypothetical protein
MAIGLSYLRQLDHWRGIGGTAEVDVLLEIVLLPICDRVGSAARELCMELRRSRAFLQFAPA